MTPSQRLLSGLIRLYPARVRREHGAEMRQMLEDLRREDGPATLRLSWDLLKALPAIHAREAILVRRLVTVGGLLEAGAVTARWTAAAFGVLALLSVLAFSLVESYVPFAPYVDTQFAAGFSWDGYARVRSGMSESEVHALLGSPRVRGMGLPMGAFMLKSGEMKGESCWQYTEDGGSPAWDFAWVEVNVCFDGRGTVAGKHEIVLYD